jgi:hypothetical protein
MTEVKEQGELSSGAQTVWSVVREFGGFVEALGGRVELEGEGIGTLRTIPMGSESVVERLDELDDENMRVRYTILQAGPLPVSDYHATMEISRSGDDACTLTWSSTFDPDGVSEEDAITAVQRMYRGAMSGLRKYLSGT